MALGITEVFLPTPFFYAAILFAVIYDLFWRGLALWKASKNEQKGWFVALLVINSVGILPLFYIFLFQKGKKGL